MQSSVSLHGVLALLAGGTINLDKVLSCFSCETLILEAREGTESGKNWPSGMKSEKPMSEPKAGYQFES